MGRVVKYNVSSHTYHYNKNKNKQKEGKKVTWEQLVAFATYHFKIRELTSYQSKKNYYY